MMRSRWLLVCAVLLSSTTTGCEVLIPLMIAAAEGGPETTPTEGVPWMGGETYQTYEQVELDVTLDEATGLVGGVALDATALHATGFLYGTSTQLHVSAAPPNEQDELIDPGELSDPVLDIWLDLCPIEDVLLNGEDTTAFVGLIACQDTICQDGTFNLQLSVVEERADERVITLDTMLEDGSPLHLRLRYTSPAP